MDAMNRVAIPDNGSLLADSVALLPLRGKEICVPIRSLTDRGPVWPCLASVYRLIVEEVTDAVTLVDLPDTAFCSLTVVDLN